MKMSMLLPHLNYSLMVELTTNIEQYIFMELKNVQVASQGAAVQSSQSPKTTYFSSQLSNEMDRVTIDFGNISVSYVLCMYKIVISYVRIFPYKAFDRFLEQKVQ